MSCRPERASTASATTLSSPSEILDYIPSKIRNPNRSTCLRKSSESPTGKSWEDTKYPKNHPTILHKWQMPDLCNPSTGWDSLRSLLISALLNDTWPISNKQTRWSSVIYAFNGRDLGDSSWLLPIHVDIDVEFDRNWRSHCECDDKFRRCLLNTREPASISVGLMFFDVGALGCFQEENGLNGHICRSYIRYFSPPSRRYWIRNCPWNFLPNKFDKPLLIEILVIILKPAARHWWNGRRAGDRRNWTFSRKVIEQQPLVFRRFFTVQEVCEWESTRSTGRLSQFPRHRSCSTPSAINRSSSEIYR